MADKPVVDLRRTIGIHLTLPTNPNPESDTNDGLQDDFIALIMEDTPMPPSVYPKGQDPSGKTQVRI